MEKLIYGSDGDDKVEVYKQPGSSYILCHGEDYDYILSLQDEIIEDGVFRLRYDNGGTAIGSMYITKSDREENRSYYLYRSEDDEEIKYYERIFSKDDKRTLAFYNFNPETLGWTNLKVDFDSDDSDDE